MAETQDEELRWMNHAEEVMFSINSIREGETSDRWRERIASSEWDASHGFPIDIVTSKLRTIIETNDRSTLVLDQIVCIVWLGLLTQRPEEIEILKWLAFQEYLLYRCRNGLTDDINHSWLDSLCQRSEEQVLPCVRSALLARLKTLGETFADDFKSLVAAPNVFLHEFDPAFSYLMVGRNNGSAMQPSTQLQQSQQTNENAENKLEPAHNINKNSHFELATLQHLQTLENHASNLEEVLESFGTRIRRRIDDLAVYREILDKAIQSLQTDISQYEHKDLDTMLAFIKFAQAGEDNDVEIWRQIDAERQSTLITVERLQKLVGPKKKKINQRNKNKNRALRKKEAPKEKEVQEEEEEEEEAPIEVQGCLGSGLVRLQYIAYRNAQARRTMGGRKG